jgi:NhaP-type Na+/H+ or K+/H+ antiporter
VGTVLRWEGIIIDPLGALLTVLVFEAILVGELRNAPTEAGMAVARTLLAAPLIGLAAAGLLILLFRRFLIPYYLDNPVALTLVIGAFTASNAIQPESGLLATTVMGVVLANQRMVDVEHIIEFKENLRVLLISSLFVILGARMKLDYLLGAGPAMILFVVILIVVIRPLAVFASTVFTKLEFRERVFLAGMAPRGIVAAAISSILALSLEDAGFANAEILVSTTFVVIIATVAVYGLGAAPLARLLRVADPKSQGVVIVGAHEVARRIGQVLQKKGVKVLLVDTNRHDTRAARMEGIAAYSGSVLSEHAISEMNLGGIGKLLAMAPSDWVNVLAVQRFSRVFGKADVYQLSPERGSEREKAGHRHLYGRRLFGPEVTYWTLQARLNGGAVVKATALTKEFDYEAFQSLYGPTAIPLFCIEEDGEFRPVTVETNHDFQPGQTLISLVEEPEEEQTGARGS